MSCCTFNYYFTDNILWVENLIIVRYIIKFYKYNKQLSGYYKENRLEK